METYYTKKEYNEMKNSLLRKVSELEKKLNKSEINLKQVREEYNILLETATEHVTEESESND